MTSFVTSFTDRMRCIRPVLRMGQARPLPPGIDPVTDG